MLPRLWIHAKVDFHVAETFHVSFCSYSVDSVVLLVIRCGKTAPKTCFLIYLNYNHWVWRSQPLHLWYPVSQHAVLNRCQNAVGESIWESEEWWWCGGWGWGVKKVKESKTGGWGADSNRMHGHCHRGPTVGLGASHVVPHCDHCPEMKGDCSFALLTRCRGQTDDPH